MLQIKKGTKLYVVFFIFLLLPVWLKAQGDFGQPATRLFNTRDGLPDNKVQYLLETQKNPFLWAATRNELCRFDGYRFTTVWEKMPEINSLAENARGELLAFHYGSEQLIACFDPNTGVKTTKRAAEIVGLKGAFVSGWSQDTALFLITEVVSAVQFNVYRLFPDFIVQRLCTINIDPVLRKRSASKSSPLCLWDEKKGSLWYSGALFGRPDLVLRAAGSRKEAVDTFALVSQRGRPAQYETVSLTLSPNQQFLISLNGSNSLWAWSESTQRFEAVNQKPDSPKAGLSLLGKDNRGAMIFSKQEKGGEDLWRLNADGSWTDLQPYLPRLNFYACAGKDFSRQIYFTSVEGLLRVNFEKPLFHHISPALTNSVNRAFRGITADQSGHIWAMAEMMGLFRLDTAAGGTAERIIVREKNSGHEALTNNALNLQNDADGFIWSARNARETHNLLRIDPNTGLADTFWLPQSQITTFLVLKNGLLLVGGHSQKVTALFMLNPSTRQFRCLTKGGDDLRFKTAPLFLLENAAGNVWVGGDEGLALFDPKAQKFLDFQGDGQIAHEFPVAALFQENGNLWCGTLGGGLRKLDLKTGAWEIFTMTSGLPSNKIAGILSDENGNLWASTFNGLSFFQYEAKLFTNFFTQNGLAHNEFNRFSFFKNADGTLFFGGLNGISYFKPAAVLASFSQGYDSLLISQVSWFAPDGKTPQEQFFNIENGQKIALPPDNRYLSIRLALANYLQSEANRFSWKLENYDDNWNLNGTNNEIIFHYLPAGTYRLRIRAANPTGVWSKNERILVIEVHEFWYKTAWFYLLMLAFVSGLFYYFYKTRVRQKLGLAENRRIRELEHLRSRLYTNITHEFRTPLTVILGMADELTNIEKARNHSDIERIAQLIKRNGQNLLRLINQLLDLSKLESGAMQVNLVRADMIVYLQYLAESFYSTAQTQGIRLVFYPETPYIVMDYDEEKMQDIVFNLLSNALKFTGEGGKVVFHAKVVDALAHTRAGMTSNSTDSATILQLKIQDTGQGISPEQLPRIFDRFYQADNSSTRKSEGTGIGLALVKELVELLGGKVLVESTLGKGTIFTVLLPITTAANLVPVPLSKPAQTVESKHIETIEPLKPQTPQPNDVPLLLVIEDNADVVAYITTILKNDYQVETAANGKVGIEKAIELVPDIVISDVMMPEKNGYEVCDTLKNDERTSHIPIVLLTAKATQEDKVAGLRAGADAYLQKPFDKAELLIRLEKLVELRQRLQERYGASIFPKPQNFQTVEAEPTLEDLFLQKIRQVILEKMGDPELGILDLCRSTRLSRTQLFRKIKALTGNNPTLFIRRMRLERAMELLKTTPMNVSEIAYEVGFSDPNYFSRIFHEAFGVAPSGVRA